MRFLAVTLLLSALAFAADRPAITGIANFVVKTDSLDDARKFYSSVLGYQEVFQHSRPLVPKPLAVFKVNDHQFIELAPTLSGESDDKLIQIGFETSDARRLRLYLASKGVTVPPKLAKDLDGNLSFTVKDPEGHTVEFVQYLKGSLHSRNAGQGLSPNRISDHMLHVGVHVKDPAAEDKFYKDILGFRFLWQGGNTDQRVEWISLLTPDGNNWIEYMVSGPNPPSPQQLGVWHHVCVGTLDIHAVDRKVRERGYTPRRDPNIARDGRWLLHLFDKHNTRVEVMVRKPVQKPCCSENHDPYIN